MSFPQFQSTSFPTNHRIMAIYWLRERRGLMSMCVVVSSIFQFFFHLHPRHCLFLDGWTTFAEVFLFYATPIWCSCFCFGLFLSILILNPHALSARNQTIIALFPTLQLFTSVHVRSWMLSVSKWIHDVRELECFHDDIFKKNPFVSATSCFITCPPGWRRLGAKCCLGSLNRNLFCSARTDYLRGFVWTNECINVTHKRSEGGWENVISGGG